jgi:hypothetical protein
MPIKGKIELFNRLKISGWLAATEDMADAIGLELVLDSNVLQSTQADKFREDLLAAGWRDGNCYFEINLDKALTDEEAQRVKLRIAGSAINLELPKPTLSSFSGAAEVGTPGLKIFIIGCPRSGTSVLVRALMSGLNLPAHGESHVMPGIAAAVHNLRLHREKFRDVDQELLIKSLPILDMEEALFAEVRKFYHNTYGEGGWIDKTPSTSAIFGATIIPRIFPDAKIIVTKRNGIEVVDSFRKKFGAQMSDATSNWSHAMAGIAEIMDSDCPALLVDQHDYANNPAAVAEEIGNYIARPGSIESIRKIFETDPQDKLSTYDWSSRMTLDDVAWDEDEKSTFRQVCGEMMEKFHYPMDRVLSVSS